MLSFLRPGPLRRVILTGRLSFVRTLKTKQAALSSTEHDIINTETSLCAKEGDPARTSQATRFPKSTDAAETDVTKLQMGRHWGRPELPNVKPPQDVRSRRRAHESEAANLALFKAEIQARYTHLTEPQMQFMAEVCDEMQKHANKWSPERYRWYKEYVQSQERLAGMHRHLADKDKPTANGHYNVDADKTISQVPGRATSLETAPCLNIMLTFAYGHADFQTIDELDRRARQRSFYIPRSTQTAHASSTTPYSEEKYTHVLGGASWPGPQDDPVRLAFNMKVALAARDGLWSRVLTLLENAEIRRPKSRISSGSDLASETERAAPQDIIDYPLDTFAWIELIANGLGANSKAFADATTDTSAIDDQGELLLATTDMDSSLRPHDQAAQQKREEQETAALSKKEFAAKQEEARVIVTRLLVKSIRRYTAREAANLMYKAAARTPEEAAKSIKANPILPWLVLAKLKQLERDQQSTAEVLEIARAALHEIRTLPSDIRNPYGKPGSSQILASVLFNLRANRRVPLPEALRIFEEFTGFDLRASMLAKDVSVAQSPKTDQYYLPPSEAALCTMLRRQIDDFYSKSRKSNYSLEGRVWAMYKAIRTAFPRIYLSSRTYRILMSTTARKLLRDYAASPKSSLADNQKHKGYEISADVTMDNDTLWSTQPVRSPTSSESKRKDLQQKPKQKYKKPANLPALRRVCEEIKAHVAAENAKPSQARRPFHRDVTQKRRYQEDCQQLQRALWDHRQYLAQKLDEALSEQVPLDNSTTAPQETADLHRKLEAKKFHLKRFQQPDIDNYDNTLMQLTDVTSIHKSELATR